MKKLALFLVLASTAFAATAGQGEVCTSKRAPVGQPMQVRPDLELTDSMKFECASLGTVTIPELYSKGWRVVYAAPMVTSTQTNAEKYAGGKSGENVQLSAGMIPSYAMKLIIEKP